jgi:hypothetical protein
MLSLGPEAVAVEPDGRGAPNASLHGRKWPCQAGVNGGRGRFRQETGLLMLFRDGPQGYSSLGGPLARLRSGECRSIPEYPNQRTYCATATKLSRLSQTVYLIREGETQ